MTVVSSSWPGQLPEDLKHLRGESRGSISPVLNKVQQPVTQRYLGIALEALETKEDHRSHRRQQEGVGRCHDRESLTLSIRNCQVNHAACLGGGHWECLPQIERNDCPLGSPPVVAQPRPLDGVRYESHEQQPLEKGPA